MIIRDKCAVLCYLNKLEQLRWESGNLPNEFHEQLEPPRSRPDLPCSDSQLAASKDVHIEVRCREEQGDVVIPESGTVGIHRNSMYLLKRTEADPYIRQRVLEQINYCQLTSIMGDPIIRQEDLRRVAVLFDKVRGLHKEAKTDNEAKLTGSFEKLIKKTVTDLKAVCSDEDKAPLLDTHVLIGKFRLYQFTGDSLCKWFDSKDQRAGGLMREINGQLTSLFVSMAEAVIASKTELKSLDTKLIATQKELDSVLQAAETLERDIQSASQERDFAKESVVQLRDQFEGQIAMLTEENQLYLDKIIKLSKQSADHSLAAISPVKHSPSPKASPRLSVSTSSCKDLSLKQLKDIIEEVYHSKVKADLRCKELKQPRETMEQHLISYLNKKYGLKRLSSEWSQSLLKAIGKYEPEDPEIATFASILRNEIDEEFKEVQEQLKQSVKEYLRHLMKIKFPYMSEAKLKTVVLEKSSGYLEETEWTQILAFFYNPDDQQFLTGLIRDLSHSKPLKDQTRHIAYPALLKVLMDFQLAGQKQFLLPFLNKFRQIDDDTDGQLTTSQFKSFVALCGLPDRMEELSREADPLSTGLVSFSTSAQLLGQQEVTVQGESISLLQKVFLEETR